MIMFLKYTSCYLFAFSATASAKVWQNVSRSQFEPLISGEDVALVAFVAPWTESSKILEPEWNLAAAEIETPLITIDCTVEVDLCSEHHITSYPAIRLFKRRRTVDHYRGPRKASEIVSYVRRSTLPTVSILDSKNITTFKSIDEFVFIAYINQIDVSMKAIFTTLASRNHHRFAFGIVSDTRLADVENVHRPSLVCYRASSGKKEVFPAEWEIQAMESFLETATRPLIGEMTRRNEMRYLQAGKSLLYIFVPSAAARSQYSTLLQPLAEKYMEYISFVTVDAVEYSHMAPGLGLERDTFPALALQNPMFGQVFPYQQGKISVEGVEDWILGIVGGRVRPWEVGGGKEEVKHGEL